MIHTQIKICGITQVEDAFTAVEAGADAIGLVFYAPSPRCVSIEKAREICLALPSFVSTVGLFVNESAESINKVLAQVPLHILQFHGDESPRFVESFKRPFLKALRVKENMNVEEAMAPFANASGILLDTYRKRRAWRNG